MPEPDAELVSVIVRSMARPTLSTALQSLATQDYAPIEVLVVAACGATHPPVAERCGPHRMRLVASTSSLSRPAAANAGLAAACGDWITFLDDDDACLPGHVSGLMHARADAPAARVVYSHARAVFADGRTERFGQPFSMMQLYERSFIHLSTAIIARSLLDEGCRFDETLDIHEDWDFFLQCAQHARFHFAQLETFRWNADAGTSGAGGGANQDDRRFAELRDRVYAKWAIPREALIDHVRSMLQKASALAGERDLGGAEAACREALDASPNDPWALNLLAMIQRSRNRLAEARATMELAAAVRPQDHTMVYNLALLCQALGDNAAAVRHCESALQLEPGFAAAQKLRATLAAAGQAVY